MMDVARAVRVGMRLANGSGGRLFPALADVLEHAEAVGLVPLSPDQAAAVGQMAARAGVPVELLAAVVLVAGFPEDVADLVEAAAHLARWETDAEGVVGVLGDALAVLEGAPVAPVPRAAVVGAFALLAAGTLFGEAVRLEPV